MTKLLLLLVLCACASADKHHDNAGTTTTAAPTKPGAPCSAGPVTVTPSGVVRGSWMQSRRGRSFQAYRGIRYAQPPVGELRFQPPVDVKKYTSEVDASEEGPACPLVVAPGENYYIDEDCLRLNVYTPGNNSSRKLPIIFFIHPGAFYSFAGRSDLFGPHYLLDHDIVLITINYRLASLGFLSTGDAVAPGNNGLKDQVSALRWVQRNAAAFGGDPRQVTVAGCSAGSISLILHMVSNMSKGLFHRGIAVSGAPDGKGPLPNHQLDLAQKQARILNCPTNSSRAIVDCLKTKTWQELANSLPQFWEFGYDPVGLWTAVVEPDVGQPRFLAVQPYEAIRSRRFSSMPLLISQTEDEFFWKAFTVTRNKTLRDRMNAEWETIAPISFNLPKANASAASLRLKQAYLGGKDVAKTPESESGLGKLYGDSWIGFNTHRTANLMCRYSAHPVWYSDFSYVGNNSYHENSTTGKPDGAAHQDDLIYLFSMSYFRPPIAAQSPPPPAPQDSVIVDRMTAIWYNFAKYGDPNPRSGEAGELAGLCWPTMKPEDRKYLQVDKEFSVHEKLHEKQLQLTFWLGGHILFKLAKAWWKEPDTGVPVGARDGCSAARMWRAACSVLVCPDADEAWARISEVAPPDTVWHSLRNCVAYQAGVWQNLLTRGVDDVMQPAAFKLAVVLRHTPTDLAVRLLAELLRLHPQSQDLTSYVLALLTDDEAAWCGACGAGSPGSPGAGGAGAAGGAAGGGVVSPAPLRDLQLFGDCELAILAASREEYEAHAKLVRAEYAALTNKNYVELRIKILNQFSQIPKLYHTPEFECFEPLARENIEREICTLREHLLTGQHE